MIFGENDSFFVLKLGTSHVDNMHVCLFNDWGGGGGGSGSFFVDFSLTCIYRFFCVDQFILFTLLFLI